MSCNGDSPTPALSSLRHFRFQKSVSKLRNNDQQSTSNGNKSSPIEVIYLDDSPINRIQKSGRRTIVLSDSETDNDSISSSSVVANSSHEMMQNNLDQLVRLYPKMNHMELQDVLKDSMWNVKKADELLRSRHQQDSFKNVSVVQKRKPVQKQRLKMHEIYDVDSGDDDEDEFFDGRNRVVYDSDDDEDDSSGEKLDENYDEDSSNLLSEDKRRVLNFIDEASEAELILIQGCSRSKAAAIISLRPFTSWSMLIRKFESSKQLNTDLLNNTTELLRMRDAVCKLMNRCQRISDKLALSVEELTLNGRRSSTVAEFVDQPTIMNAKLKLTDYQLIGLNWLILMHKHSINGILADEMGLGKTIQSIAFLAYLKEIGVEGPHLIVVPSSTLDNWMSEFSRWCPSIKVLNYYGNQDERRHMRVEIVEGKINFEIIIATYTMVVGSSEDRILFRKIHFHYVVLDEAHMLKNMNSQRYENLMKVNAPRKLLLTGTPLQNNLVELMALLVFVMPGMFAQRREQLKSMFALFPKQAADNSSSSGRSKYEKDRILHAKRIMKPFFLRRLKSDVLKHLPKKTVIDKNISMLGFQKDIYAANVERYKNGKDRKTKDVLGSKRGRRVGNELESGVGMLMNLRKIANHPLLIRNLYSDKELIKIAKTLIREDHSHREASETLVVEDLYGMSDLEIHKTCKNYPSLSGFMLSDEQICSSGKFVFLDDCLPSMKKAGDKVLIFSQFTMVLDLLQSYLIIRKHSFLRLDGCTPVQERQPLIDAFNDEDAGIFIFLLSTRAGGLGINLSSANVVIIHDLDFNPYNDKQAEDRSHRVGQTREVSVLRLVSQDSVEETILLIANEKLELERQINRQEDGQLNVDDDHELEESIGLQNTKRLLDSVLNIT